MKHTREVIQAGLRKLGERLRTDGENFIADGDHFLELAEKAKNAPSDQAAHKILDDALPFEAEGILLFLNVDYDDFADAVSEAS